ncbi:ABC transporter substrate-binding protein [Lacticaseibacillus absianus]|uniref:ABC transporter substrate-binding protein n=1 Tax=Lacticaseibacillus absianus TaxID=2729623 RepID=UPI0015CEB734|nr:ABC transporter substrate-binding protein [Lacticaseibacillus absianus]
MKKRIGEWLTLGVALVGVLAACGQQKQAAHQPVEITYWHRMTGDWNKAQQKMIDDFNKSQRDYKVVAVSQGSYDALQQKIMAAAKSKTLPTMAQAPYTNIGDYVAHDFLTPWDPEMTAGANKLSAAQRADLYPSFLAAGQYRGKTYGLPYSVSTSVLFYNQDLMTRYGLKLPRTWADIEAMGAKLHAAGIAAVALDQSYDVVLEGMAQQSGRQLITADGQANLAAPTTLQAVDTLLRLRKAGTLRTAGADGYFTNAFINGQAVFAIGSSASIPVLQGQAPKSLHWGTAQIPGVDGHNGTPLNGNDNVLFKGASAAQRRGAWAFQKFLLKAKNAGYWAAKSGYVPVTKSGVASATYQRYLKQNPAFKAATAASAQAFASTVFAGYTDYRNALLTTVDSTLTKQTPGKTAFTALQQQTERILAEAK